MKQHLLFLGAGILSGLFSIYSLAKYYSLGGIGALNSQEASKLISDGKIKFIIDVRTKTEWNVGHHKEAIHLPVSEIKDGHSKLRHIYKGDGILVYCNTGQRARYAAQLLRNYGYKNVFYLTGGYTGL